MSEPVSSRQKLRIRCNHVAIHVHEFIWVCNLLHKSKYFSVRSIQLRTCRDVVVHHEKMEFLVIAVLLAIDSREKHSSGIDAHHLPRRKIGDGDQGLSNQLFRLVISVNTGKYDAVSAGSVIQNELQELL